MLYKYLQHHIIWGQLIAMFTHSIGWPLELNRYLWVNNDYNYDAPCLSSYSNAGDHYDSVVNLMTKLSSHLNSPGDTGYYVFI